MGVAAFPWRKPHRFRVKESVYFIPVAGLGMAMLSAGRPLPPI